MDLLGLQFDSYKNLKEYLERYQDENYVQLKVALSDTIEARKTKSARNIKLKLANKDLKYTSLTYKCIHGDSFKPRGTGERKTVSFKQECPFTIKLKLTRNAQRLIVTKVIDGHNHDVSKEIYYSLPRQRKLSADDREKVRDMLNSKCSKELVKNYIKANLGKNIILKDLNNLNRNRKNLKETKEEINDSCPEQKKSSVEDTPNIPDMLKLKCNRDNVNNCNEPDPEKSSVLEGLHDLKLSRNRAENIEEVVNFLSTSEAHVELLVEGSKLEGIFFETAEMKRAFESYPEVVLVDNTHCLRHLHMPVYVIMVINGNGEAQVAAIFLLADETKDNVKKMLSIFKKCNDENSSKIESLFTSKEFKETNTLQELFPEADHLISFFHTLKSFKKHVSFDKKSRDLKKEALSLIEKIVYSSSEMEYENNYEALRDTNYLELLDYFETNWHPIRYEWVRGFIKYCKTYNLTTTHHIEYLNNKIKHVVSRSFHLLDFFKDFIICMNTIFEEQKHKAINLWIKNSNQFIKETDEELYNSYLTPHAWDIVSVSLKDASELLFCTEISSTELTCECSLVCNTGLPCCHIFYRRKESNLDLFCTDLIPIKLTRHYFYSYFVQETITEIPSSPLKLEPIDNTLEGSSTPEPIDILLEGSSIPEPIDILLEGSSTPEPIDILLEGSSTPEPIDIPLEGSSTPEPIDIPLDGSSTPEPIDIPLEGSSTPEPIDIPLEGEGSSTPEAIDISRASRMLRITRSTDLAKEKVLSKREKYNKITALCSTLSSVVSDLDTSDFNRAYTEVYALTTLFIQNKGNSLCEHDSENQSASSSPEPVETSVVTQLKHKKRPIDIKYSDTIVKKEHKGLKKRKKA